MLEYAEAVNASPSQVDDDLRARMREEFSEKQMVELTYFIAVENARARFNRAFDIQPEGFTQQDVG